MQSFTATDRDVVRFNRLCRPLASSVTAARCKLGMANDEIVRGLRLVMMDLSSPHVHDTRYQPCAIKSDSK